MKTLWIMIMLAALATAHADVYYWTQTASGEWDVADGNHWSLNSVSGSTGVMPPTTEHAWFNQAMDVTVTAADDFEVARMQFNNPSAKVLLNPQGHVFGSREVWINGLGNLVVTNGTFGVPSGTPGGEIVLGSTYPAMGPSLFHNDTITVAHGGVLNTATLRIGHESGSIGNRLDILAGGTATVTSVIIGYIDRDTLNNYYVSLGLSSNNMLRVKGAGASLLANSVSLGNEGASWGLLEVADGGTVEAAGLSTGSCVAQGNTLFVHDGGSLILTNASTNATLNIGGNGAYHRAIISNATLQSGRVRLTGIASGTISSNGLVVTDGATFAATGTPEGHGYNVVLQADDNYALIEGANTSFLATEGIMVGVSSVRTRFTVKDVQDFTFGSGVNGLWLGTYGNSAFNEFTLDGAVVTVNGRIDVGGASNNTLRVANGSVLTFGATNGNGLHLGNENGGCGNRLIVESGGVVTNTASTFLGSAEGDSNGIILDNGTYVGIQYGQMVMNPNRLLDNYIAIRGTNSLFHFMGRIYCHPLGEDYGANPPYGFPNGAYLDFLVGKHGYARTPIVMETDTIGPGITVYIHADEWAQRTGGEVTLITSMVNAIPAYYADNAFLDTPGNAIDRLPGTYWLDIRHELIDPG
ncbi:MAG: hypothetical protein FWF84_07765, partial [Kiritimatiellaeota bacterium]|nr:hypothetical protein [Kiritimatiellota bacterium]